MKTALSGCLIASWALVCLNTRCNPFQTQRWANGMNIDLASALWRALAAICRPAFHLLPSLSLSLQSPSSHLFSPLYFMQVLFPFYAFFCFFGANTLGTAAYVMRRFLDIAKLLQFIATNMCTSSGSHQ